MAARQQPRGTGLGVQYEDFVPKSEWKDQPEATVLTIDLPGWYTKYKYIDCGGFSSDVTLVFLKVLQRSK